MFEDYDYEYYEDEDYNLWEAEQVFHEECLAAEEEAHEIDFDMEDNDDLPYYHNNFTESEYQRGIAEGKLWSAERRIYGDDLVEQWEIEKEMREGW